MIRQWVGIAGIAVRQRLELRFDFLMTLVATLLYGAMLFMVWRAVYTHLARPPLPWTRLITYVMIGQAVSLGRWSPADRAPVYEATGRIMSGDIALDLVRPVGYLTQRFLQAAGFFAVELLWVNLPALVLFTLVLGLPPPADALAAAAFALSLCLAFLVSFSLNSLVIMLAFWTTNTWGVQNAKRAVLEVLSGTLIPFAFLPAWLHAVVTWLPFQAMAYLPLSIYIGVARGPAVPAALLQQAGWAAVMLGLSWLLWRRAFRRVEVFGG